jgi:XTP/dITP diphosphohydrolase
VIEFSTLVLASSNEGKLFELRDLLSPTGIAVRSQGEFDMPETAETGSTFIENAILKARAASRYTGLPAMADDSGLSVDALDGRPGVYSARYAGDGASDARNNARLLEEMGPVPEVSRTAHYCCALILMRHCQDPMPLCCVGTWHGCILEAPRGVGGFGYDPLFLLPELGKSAAELDPGHKNCVSHRGKAFRSLLALLQGRALP